MVNDTSEPERSQCGSRRRRFGKLVLALRLTFRSTPRVVGRRLSLTLLAVLTVAIGLPLLAGTAYAALGSTTFAPRPVDTSSAAQAVVVPLHESLSDLPAGSVLYGGGDPAISAALGLAGLPVPLTSDGFVAVAGDASVSFAVTGASGQGDVGDFPVDFADCLAAVPGTSCSLSVRFTPTAAGARHVSYLPVLAQVTLTADNPAVQQLLALFAGTLGADVANQLSVDLSGTATPALVVQPTIAFGNVRIGGSSTVVVPVANQSDVDITLDPQIISGIQLHPQFTVASGSCAAPVPAHSVCSIEVTFEPTNANTSHSDFLALGPSGPLETDVGLTGQGIYTLLSLDQDSLGFGSVAVGEVSGPQQFTVFNDPSATAPLDVSGVTTSADFAQVDWSDCVAPVNPGDSCTVAVSFSPTRLGPRSAKLVLVSDATPTGALTSISVAVGGVGTTSADVSTHLAATSTRGAGKTFAKVAYTVTVKNSGPSAAAGTRVTLTLPVVGEFISIDRAGCVVPVVGSTGSVSCTLGSLASGAGLSIKVVVRVPEATGTVVTASSAVSGSVFDPVLVNNNAVRTLTIK